MEKENFINILNDIFGTYTNWFSIKTNSIYRIIGRLNPEQFFNITSIKILENEDDIIVYVDIWFNIFDTINVFYRVERNNSDEDSEEEFEKSINIYKNNIRIKYDKNWNIIFQGLYSNL